MPGLIEEPQLSPKELKKLAREQQKAERKAAKEAKRKTKRNKKAPEVEQIDLGERAGDEFIYVPADKKKRKDFLDTVALSDFKSILYGYPNQPIRLANGYSGYLQIFEVFGQDIQAMSEAEQAAIIASFTLFLSGTTFDIAIQTTKLPTDVTSQSNELMRILDDVRQAQNSPELLVSERNTPEEVERIERKLYQLRQREDILLVKYLIQQLIAINQQNIEFFIWVFADSLAEMDANTRTTATIAAPNFAPKVISAEKKEELLRQFYNFNDSL